MPIPQRTPLETRDEFIGRCMSDDVMVSEYPDLRQRSAICYLQLSTLSSHFPK